ncbi:unnamed protein product [Periconia digitata]|uniref:MARVEL domain-containing protein n=1 Tax=Periconia digitata TaxID=1303443 RepID=A0A9W4UFR8_9PLEO|nr:unnamed protein product [Periconia digitata]
MALGNSQPREPSIEPDIQYIKTSTSFKDAVYTRRSRPLAGLFELGIRIFQFIFALASGISYAIELSHSNTSPSFIYTQVVFGLTLLTLIIEAITLRSFRAVFLVESVICILWLALFGVFYTIYIDQEMSLDPRYANVELRRMRNAVWLDLVNFVLWLASAIFSTIMCCSGTKAAVRGKLNGMKAKRRNGKYEDAENGMESGVVRTDAIPGNGDRLPTYEVVMTATREGRL